MKIDKDKQLQLLDSLSKSSSLKSKKDTQVAARTTGGTQDKVELSVWKQEVSRLVEKAKAMPDVNEEKVAQIQQELATQTYNPRGELVARSLLKGQFLDEIL
jgi:flagellar biosynthesis anti-sigma factor FlgM